MRGRILVIDHRTPTPDQDSGSASTFAYLQILAGAGFDVTFAPAGLDACRPLFAGAAPARDQDAGEAPVWTSLEQVVRHVRAALRRCCCSIGPPIASQVFDLARRVAPAGEDRLSSGRRAFPADGAAGGIDRRAGRGRGGADHARHRARPDRAGGCDDRGEHPRAVDPARARCPTRRCIGSRSCASRRRRARARAGISFAAGLRCVSTAPGRREPGPRQDVLFIGGYEHLPNVDAVQWFVREVWPLIRARGGSHRFVIAGAKVPAEIAALAADDIEVRGWVAELAPLFAACRLSVAPLRYGGGIKGKIVSSLSYGVPVVASSIAAEGMELQHEENILVADTPRDYRRSGHPALGGRRAVAAAVAQRAPGLHRQVLASGRSSERACRARRAGAALTRRLDLR